jgi:hypothetical protein
MTAPIIVYRPLLHLQPLDEAGADDGAAVDVTCDMASVELNVETPTVDVATYCGNFTIPDDINVDATFEVTVNADTDANWSALVGRRVRAELYDRTDATKYRTFETQIMLNPSLYGPTTPGEARTFSFDQAVLSDVEWVTVTP